jgi:uncharacterized protein
MEQLLALFPLNLVLFPGMTLPLHIFEPRYRQMINRCVQLKQPFGVVLISEGEAEGGPVAEPFEIGTTAVIQTVLKLEDGRLLLSAVGERRFRITSIVQREPYMVAAVEYLEEAASSDAAALAEQIRSLYVKHRDALTQAIGVEQQMDDLPDDPVALSYQLSAEFRVVDGSKQQLLEADLDDRLQAILEALDRELRLLPQSSSGPAQMNSGPWSLN